jgi:MFS transporter, DHA2 family, multidrug resistance protein
MSKSTSTLPARGAARAEPGRERWWALGALTLSFLVVGLDSYILVTALPTLSVRLGATTSQLQWITAAYTLAWAGLLLPIGKLGDKLGRRKLLLAGLTVFGLASVAASQASSAAELIAARAVMGAGAAVIMPMGLAIIPILFPAQADRRRAVTVTTMGAIVALPLGPLLGGWLLTHFAWGSVFLINAPVVALTLLGVALLVPESRDPAAARLDWAGALLGAAGVVAVIYAIIEQPVSGWGGRVLGCLLGGLVLLALFAVRQRRARWPLIDPGLLHDRLFGWGTIAFAAISFALSGVLFMLTPYLQLALGASALGTGVRLLPMIGAMLAAAAGGEKLAARLGIRLVIGGSMVVSAAGLLVLAGDHAGYGGIALALAVFGAGLGLGLPLAADTVLSALAPEQTGMGNALSRTVQSIGVALGTAVLGSVLSSGYRGQLAAHLAGLPPAARTAAAASLAGAHRLAGLARAADAAYGHGLASAALVCTGLLLATALLCLTFLPARATPPE